MQLKMVRYACIGTNTDGGHPGIPPPLKIASIILIPIVVCNNNNAVTFHQCMWSQKPPDTASDITNFQGEHAYPQIP